MIPPVWMRLKIKDAKAKKNINLHLPLVLIYLLLAPILLILLVLALAGDLILLLSGHRSQWTHAGMLIFSLLCQSAGLHVSVKSKDQEVEIAII